MNARLQPARNLTHCVITGCALVLEGEQCFAWGDLHRQGESMIFLAVTDKTGRIVRKDLGHSPPHSIVIPKGADYFVRNGVYVMPANRGWLNRSAQSYVTEYGW